MIDQRSDSAESDLSEGELGGAERMELFSDIIQTINKCIQDNGGKVNPVQPK